MMWNKKLIVVTLILLSLFMISTVSAATDTTEDLVKSDVTHEEKISHTTDTPTDTSSNSENVADKSTDIISEKKSISTNEKKESDGKLSSTPENNVLKADKKTFSELNKTISDAGNNPTEITLQHDYIQDMDSDIEIKDGQKITIQGNGHTLDAKCKSRIFTVNGELILKNLKLINGKIITNEAYGGAIFAINSVDLTIINCTFINNTVEGQTFGWGGAICSKNANIINSTFTGNTANDDGGAIYILKNDRLTISNSKFIENNATKGGAISTGTYATLSITNTTFTKNNAHLGGAIYLGSYSNMNLTKCIFTNNNATQYGGAIRSSGNININNTLFNQNNANTGSGIYAQGNVYIKNSAFIKDNYEDAITLDTNTKTGINPGTFAALDAMINTCGFDTITLDENYKYNTTSGSPDSEFKDGIPITKKVTINGNGFTIDGSQKARIFNVTGDDVSLENIIFINGYADEGGAIYVDGNHSNVENCTFINNNATNEGGAILWSGSGNDGYVSDCIFVNNSATRFGAVALSSGKSYVSACIFVNNSDKEDGVVGHAWDTYTYTEINNNIFLNNNATYAICLTGGNANLDYNWFGNNATNYTNNLPIAGTFDYNYWLFLNATPDTFIIGETNEIVFKLDLYNKTSQKVVKDYDTNHLKPVKLTITNDNVDEKVALLGEPIKYNAKNTGKDTITASIENVKYTKEVNIVSETSFTALYNNITKYDTITLNHDYTYNSSTDTAFQDGILINKTITINGNGYSISGNNSARIFYVEEGSNLTLKNLNLIKGKTTNYGGAILITDNAKVTITNCNFTQNNAPHGGAITIGNGNLTISNSNFNNNNASNKGGAITITDNAKVTITNCNFTQNNAISTSIQDGGGAIYTENSNITITRTTLTNNNAPHGGAIYTDNAKVTITNCNFTQNNATYDGGAIHTDNTNVTVNYCNFTQNNAENDGGGAIYAYEGANVNINNTIFTQNNANGGGAIFSYLRANVNINNTIFTQNQAENDGGAINAFTDGTVNLNNTIFTQNKAENDGGAIYTVYRSKTNVISSLFMDNTANNKGCAIYGYSFDDLTVNHNIFLNNTGTNVIYLYNNTEYGSEFVYNLDYNWFGNNALDYMTINGIISGGTLTNWLFLNATANPNPVQVLSTANVTFKLSSYNSSSNNVSIYDNSQLKPVNLTLTSVNGTVNKKIVILGEITEYTTKVSGIGSVTASIDGISYTKEIKAIKDTSFTALYNNITQSTDPSTITLTQDYIYDENTDKDLQTGIPINKTVIIQGNGHTINGLEIARIFNITSNGNLTLENLTLINGCGQNVTLPNGEVVNIAGAIFLDNNTVLSANNCNFTNNNAADMGGAICAGNSTLNINNTIFTSNNAVGDGSLGGAIHIDSNSTLNINNTQFINNTADYGGAIATYDSHANISNTEFINNSAYCGGAIDTDLELIINDCNFTNNTADYGGAIDTYTTSNTIINNTEFNDNNAQYGGAIYIAGDLTTLNSVFNNNTAISGGAILIGNTITANINNTTFTNNTADYGGAIYTNSDLTVQNSLFKDNNANRGSGVYVDNAVFTNKNNKFINNDIDGANYKVKPIDPKITIENISDTVEGSPVTITVNADNEFNTCLILNVNGNNYTVKMINGKGQITISDLKPGTYTATIQFNGNENYTNTTVTSNTFKVNTKPTPAPSPSPSPEPIINPTKTVYKVKIYLTLKKVKKVSKKTRKLYLKVIVKRNGKKLLTKKITLKVKRNKVKTKKSSKKTSKKSKKVSKVKNYRFTVKINGKTYSKKTNKKGKITYTITNLYKKGTYKAKISYKSKYYKKNGKTIKFKIKK